MSSSPLAEFGSSWARTLGSCMLYFHAGPLIQLSICVLRLFLISSNGQKAISEHLNVLLYKAKLFSCSIMKTQKILKLHDIPG